MASDDEDLDLDALRAAALKSCNIIENKSNLPKRSSIHINPRKVQVSNNAQSFNAFPKKSRGQNYERQNYRRAGRNKYRSQRNSNLVVLTQPDEPKIESSQTEMIRPQDKWGGTKNYEKKNIKDSGDKFKRYDDSESDEEVNSRTSTPPIGDIHSDENIKNADNLNENSYPREDAITSTKDDEIEFNNELLNAKYDKADEFDKELLEEELNNGPDDNIEEESDDITKEQIDIFNSKDIDDDFLQTDEEDAILGIEKDEKDIADAESHQSRKRTESETSALSLRAPSDYDDILDEGETETKEEKSSSSRVRSRSPVGQRRIHDRVRNSPPYSDDDRKQRERDRRRGRHKREKKSRSRSRSKRLTRENNIESRSNRNSKVAVNSSRDSSRSPAPSRTSVHDRLGQRLDGNSRSHPGSPKRDHRSRRIVEKIH